MKKDCKLLNHDRFIRPKETNLLTEKLWLYPLQTGLLGQLASHCANEEACKTCWKLTLPSEGNEDVKAQKTDLTAVQDLLTIILYLKTQNSQYRNIFTAMKIKNKTITRASVRPCIDYLIGEMASCPKTVWCTYSLKYPNLFKLN